jgi:hypothetical protein
MIVRSDFGSNAAEKCTDRRQNINRQRTQFEIFEVWFQPFASAKNIQVANGVALWTDNISHGELIRSSNDETLTIDPDHLPFVFRGLLQKQKRDKGYGAFPSRIGMLSPAKPKQIP